MNDKWFDWFNDYATLPQYKHITLPRVVSLWSQGSPMRRPLAQWVIPCGTTTLSLSLTHVISKKLRKAYTTWNFCPLDSHTPRFFVSNFRWKLLHCVTLSKFRLINTLKSKQKGRHFADDIFKLMFLYEVCCSWLKSLEICSRWTN